MFSLVNRRPSDPAPQLTEFEAAKARWSAVATKDRELRDKRDAILLARSLAATGPDIGPTTMPKAQQEKAAPYRKLAQKNPRRLADELAEVEAEIEDYAPTLAAEREAWEAAQRREANRIAAELQPRQRAAVRRLADALEALSLAIEDEAEIHDEFRHRSPLPTSALLPELGADFHDIAVSRQYSRGWHWSHRINKLGVLSDG